MKKFFVKNWKTICLSGMIASAVPLWIYLFNVSEWTKVTTFVVMLWFLFLAETIIGVQANVNDKRLTLLSVLCAVVLTVLSCIFPNMPVVPLCVIAVFGAVGGIFALMR